MKAEKKAPGDIDEYIAGFPAEVQEILQKIRATISKAAPRAEEAIKYQIPTFTMEGNLIHFAAFRNHVGLYPAPRGVKEFEDELSRYEGGKGTVQFPLDEPIPHGLIRRIVKFRLKRLREGTRPKAKKR